MWYIIAGVLVVWIGFILWVGSDRKKRNNRKKDKPAFHTEEDLEEYGKPMNPPPVDFDDAE